MSGRGKRREAEVGGRGRRRGEGGKWKEGGRREKEKPLIHWSIPKCPQWLGD